MIDTWAGKLPMAGLGALATQLFKKHGNERTARQLTTGSKKSRAARDTRRIRDRPREEEEWKDSRECTVDAETSSTSRSGHRKTPSSISHQGPRRCREEQPRSSPRRASQRSRESSHYSDRSRRPSGKKERGYDSGYASEATASDGHESTPGPSREERRKRQTGGRRLME